MHSTSVLAKFHASLISFEIVRLVIVESKTSECFAQHFGSCYMFTYLRIFLFTLLTPSPLRSFFTIFDHNPKFLQFFSNQVRGCP